MLIINDDGESSDKPELTVVQEEEETMEVQVKVSTACLLTPL